MSAAASIARFYGRGKEQKNSDGYLTMCPVHGNENTPSLSVRDSGDQDVDVYCHGAGCDWKEIKDRFRQDGLLPEWKPERPARRNGTAIETPSADTEKESFVWKQASKEGLEHAAKYLAGRAITIPLPKCAKWTSYIDKKTGEQVNAIVFAASLPTDKNVYAVQRLFIDIETHKKIGAKMHGPCEGRGVWFNRKGDMEALMIGEGLETTMSAIQATNGVMSGVAALSTSGMKNLVIPDETKTIYILVDSDPVRDKETASMPGQKAAYVTAIQFEATRPGRKAFLVSPDDSCFTSNPNKVDFNDILKADPSGESICRRLEQAIPFKELQWSPGGDEALTDEQDAPLQPLTGNSDGTLDPLQCFDGEPPMKQWHVQGLVPAGCCVVINGQGGTSKSTTVLLIACSMASGRSIPPFEVDPAGKRILFLNVEDGEDDLQRSLYYLNQHYRFTREERQRIASNLLVFPGRGLVGAMLCKSFDGLPVPTVHGEWLMKSLENIDPDVVVIDTKSRTYGLDENSNSDNAAYISFFERHLPKRPKTTFLIIHHNSKERAGDGGQSSARGGSALIDNARGNLVFTHMTEAEAQKHGVSHLDYFIMTNAKNNYARRSDRSIFTRVDGGVPVLVDLENESRGAALDRLIGLLIEDYPGGIQKRELLERDGGKAIRDTLGEEYAMRKPDFKRLVEFGVESARLVEREDAESGSHNKPVLICVRTVTAPKSGLRQLDFCDSANR